MGVLAAGAARRGRERKCVREPRGTNKQTNKQQQKKADSNREAEWNEAKAGLQSAATLRNEKGVRGGVGGVGWEKGSSSVNSEVWGKTKEHDIEKQRMKERAKRGSK